MRIALPSRYLMCYSSCASVLHNESFISHSPHPYSNLVLSGDSMEMLVVYYYYSAPFIYFSTSQIINTCIKESY